MEIKSYIIRTKQIGIIKQSNKTSQIITVLSGLHFSSTVLRKIENYIIRVGGWVALALRWLRHSYTSALSLINTCGKH